MPHDVLEMIQAWALSLLIYPGLVFGVAIFVAGEWLVGGIRPALSSRLYRTPAHRRPVLQPVYDILKLAGRRWVMWPWAVAGNDALSVGSERPGVAEGALALTTLLGPVLALALLPVHGSSLLQQTGIGGDLIIVIALLVVHPLAMAALRLRQGGLTPLRGAQDIGRLLIGSVPVLAVIAALVEVSPARSLQTAALSVAPERPEQTLVRLLTGVVLLLALPWWLGGTDAVVEGAPAQAGGEAAIRAGALLQTSALSAFWQTLIVPAPSDQIWAVVIAVGGTLFAYTGFRLVAERWVATRRESDMAGLLWVIALPPAVLALVLALWPTG